MSLRLELHPRQSQAFSSAATEILYGGAAGGGKSHLLRVAAIAWCVAIPGLQVYLFRRTSPDLRKNHMEGPSSFPMLLEEWINAGVVQVNDSKGFIAFANKSKIHLCHCQYEKDVTKYQGAEIHVLLLDELTHFTRKQYTYLRSRVRLAGLEPPEEYRDRFPRIIAGSNPGGVGHNWVKAMFVDAAAPMECWRTPYDEGGMLRQYVPARLEDNPTLLRDDPDYEQRLEGLGDPALVRAMRSGDWDIVAGGMFDDVWDRAVHILPWPTITVPASWWLDRALDWGSSKPFSVGWWAESDGTPLVRPDGTSFTYPRGTLIRIAEWYGWNGKVPNVGLRMADRDVAKGILERQKDQAWGKRVKSGPADTMIFNVEPGRKSIADEMKSLGVSWTEADQKPYSRKTGWEAMRRRLRATKERDMDQPHLYVLPGCLQFVRTVPVLPRSERDPDDVDTDAEDHIGDETRYRIMAPKRHAGTFEFRV